MGDTILIVDDEPLVRRSIQSILSRRYPLRYLEASRVEEAEALLAADPSIALILCDLNMPGASGLQLIETLQPRMPEVCVVLVTATAQEDTAIEALRSGVYGYVTKPFLQNELVVQVEGALQRREVALRQRAALQAAHQEMLLRLTMAAEFRDDETGAHVQRMRAYAGAMAAALGWPTAAVAELHLAAALHDVGKIGIADEILRKPGRLTDAERQAMQEHTRIGHRILAGSENPVVEMAARIALHHHERWDGMGYPDGLAGEAIPIEARIVAIADVYDALSHERVYKAAWPEADVLALLERERGRGFDPSLIDIFLQILPEIREIRATMSA